MGDEVVLTVTDDGVGITDDGRRSGLANMAERAEAFGGSFEVRRAGPVGGTLRSGESPPAPPTETSRGLSQRTGRIAESLSAMCAAHSQMSAQSR